MLAVFLLAACGGHGGSQGLVVGVTERDFAIDAPATLRPGKISFHVKNEGPVAHELIIVRTASQLPLRSDGITADEEGLAPVTLGSLEPGKAGSMRTLNVTLPPGRYELYCNMNGHYRGGMHVTLEVR